MKSISLVASACVACALVIAGCATNDPVASPRYDLPPVRSDTIARLAVDGPNAYINGIRVQNGSYVVEGDTVSTGPGTSAKLMLNAGGSIRLDENTDPLFRLLRQGACVLMEIIRGQAAVATSGSCVEFRSERLNTAGVAHSVINIQALEREAWITAIEGHVDMLRPRAVPLGSYDQYIGASDGTWQVRRLTQADANAVGAWTQRYFRASASAPPSSSVPGALAIGAIIGAIIGTAQGDRRTRALVRGATAHSIQLRPVRMFAVRRRPTPDNGYASRWPMPH